MGAVYEKGDLFREEAIAIFPNLQRIPDIEDARREGLLWVFKNPQLFGKALSEQRKYPAVKAEMKAAAQTTIARNGLSNEAGQQYVGNLLPSRYPSGLVIADESKRQYKFRALSFEVALSEASTADAQAHATEQDLADLQHAVSVVPYVDVAILDGNFCKRQTIV